MRALLAGGMRRTGAVAVACGSLVGGMMMAAPGTASAQVLTCGSTITTSVTLTANVDCTGDTAQNALTVGAVGVTLNLNGYKILGPGAGAQTEGVVDLGYGGLTVENGTISNFYIGADVEGASGSDLTGVVVQHVTTANSSLGAQVYGVYGDYLDGASIHNLSLNDAYYGVELDNSQDSTVSYNKVTAAFYGLTDYQGTANTWSHNTVTGTNYDGLSLHAGTGLVVKGNTFTGTVNAVGVYVDSSSASVTTNILNNLYEGIYDYANTGDTFRYNKGTGDAWGIDAYYPNGETYHGNKFSYGTYGIEADYPTSDLFQFNTTNHNSEAGIFLFTDDDPNYSATLTSNTGNYNRFGLYSQFATSGSGNSATGNKVVNCYNVTCQTGTAASRLVAQPPHRIPAVPPTPAPLARP